MELNHGSKAQFAQPGSIKLIDTVKIEAQAADRPFQTIEGLSAMSTSPASASLPGV
ncbi:hypothetical protein Brsp01_06010 [Brucella sp. NBRC 12950]|nr:hypothetical protein Brsp01_06010 [Brucella sp. NBRC 12950]